MVVDPSLTKDDKCKRDKERNVLVGSSSKARIMPLEVELYQGGYLDFIDYSILTDNDRAEGPSRISIMDDLCFYLEHYGTMEEQIPPSRAGPISMTFFLQKIIASNYMILAGYLDSCLNELELAIRLAHIRKGTKDSALNISENWSILQSWSHRFPEYCGMLKDILHIHSKQPQCSEGERARWDECKQDFEAISARMDSLRERADLLAESFVGLASMAGMQESLDEAKNVQILTFLGIFFLPLSWVASIFAITERPDPQGFLLYCKTAFPTAFGLVLVVAACLFWRKRHD